MKPSFAKIGWASVLAIFVGAFFIALRTERSNQAIASPVRQPSIYVNGLPQSDDEMAITSLLSKSNGFQRLESGERAKLLKYVCGRNASISESARIGLQKLLESSPQRSDDANSFRDYMKKQPYARETAYIEDWHLATAHNFTKRSKPTLVHDFTFYSGVAEANRYTVSIGATAIVIQASLKFTKEPSYYRTPKAVAAALGQLPQYILKLIKEVWIEPDENPDNPEWQRRHRNDVKTFMTAGMEGIIRIYPSRSHWGYFAQGLVHESGHILSLSQWGNDSESPLWAPWKTAMKSDALSPSNYAKTSVEEDFAEMMLVCFLYKGQPEEMEIKSIFPARFALIEKLIHTRSQNMKPLFSE